MKIAAVVAAIVVALALWAMLMLSGAGYVAGMSGLCGSCHVMKPWTTSWHASSHAKTACYSCHDSLYAWYDLPRHLFGSRSMLIRQVYSTFHIVGHELVGEDPSHPRSGETTSVPSATSDMVCLGCHTMTRTPSSRERITIDHENHAKANDSCISCHLVTTHPDPEADQLIAMMTQCYTCHDLNDERGAPGTCETCHPDHFDLLPASHDPAAWPKQHGKSALDDRDQCFMCHETKVCRDCHGIDMPHPVDWTSRESGHPTMVFEDRQVCAMCHPAQPDPCGTCHHKGHDPSRGPWAENHLWIVRETGTAECMRCHDGLFCKECHE